MYDWEYDGSIRSRKSKVSIKSTTKLEEYGKGIVLKA